MQNSDKGLPRISRAGRGQETPKRILFINAAFHHGRLCFLR